MYLLLAYVSNSWPHTEGVIVKSELITNKVEGKYLYIPAILYSYSVNGREYMSNKIGFYAISEGKIWAKRIVDDFNVGSSVKVFFFPFYPKLSVLYPGVKQVWLWRLTVLLLIVTVLLAILLMDRRTI